MEVVAEAQWDCGNDMMGFGGTQCVSGGLGRGLYTVSELEARSLSS